MSLFDFRLFCPNSKDPAEKYKTIENNKKARRDWVSFVLFYLLIASWHRPCIPLRYLSRHFTLLTLVFVPALQQLGLSYQKKTYFWVEESLWKFCSFFVVCRLRDRNKREQRWSKIATVQLDWAWWSSFVPSVWKEKDVENCQTSSTKAVEKHSIVSSNKKLDRQSAQSQYSCMSNTTFIGIFYQSLTLWYIV